MRNPTLPLTDYRALVDLDELFLPQAPAAHDEGRDRLVRDALQLLADDPAVTDLGVAPGQLLDAAQRGRPGDARRLLDAVLTIRGPGPRPAGLDASLDALLGAERGSRHEVDATTVPTVADALPDSNYPAADRVAVWRGDITALGADAIVNAANSALLGCRRPGHACIDNAIHAAAGPRLREDCAAIIDAQGHDEPTGTAKITRGYHLPAAFVLHTVGPIVHGPLSAAHQAALADAYLSCLEVAAEVQAIRTVAFCSISTGVFGYPKQPAAQVALRTVADWFATHPGRLDRVLFDVFGADDHAVYTDALTNWTQR